ncbi:hypothetical protein [Halorussus sp. MSC15.2]|uniref:DUF7504 family protein n=1 Tax=Halorussus sp. MSC15.2 TaxID=2283638 RepID=UPI0013D1A547|nr:hypothetical protein [Halorussus sp. MSC15.2]NEU56630.1 hypothetical protein [Halorussus sp. MSC15.2]
MTQRQTSAYEFADDLPIEGVEPGSNLLVAGPTMGGARDLALRLVTAGSDREEGLVLVTTTKSGGKILSECDKLCTGLQQSTFGVVDCVSKKQGREQTSERIETVSSPGDLTGIGIEFSGLYQSVHRETTERVRAGLFSLSTLLMYTEFQTVSRFVHTVAGRIGATDGLGVFLIDPSTQDERVVNTITQLCDGRVDVRVRGDGTREMRVRGLADQPREWTPF